MKQLNLALAAVAALGMASCSSDEPSAPNTGADGMTFTVKMPAQQALSRAFSDGELATQLTWAAYEVNGSAMKYITQATSTPAWVQNTTDGTLDANISIDLAVGKSYRLIFFAKDSSNTFTSLAFNTNDAKLTCNYQNITGNDESYDAFYQKLDVTVTPSYAGGEVTLYRPFAQLNVGTNDLTNPFVASAYTDGVQTKVTVSKVATEFDLLNDAVLTTNELSNATFGPTAQATATDGNFPVAGTPAYAWLAMDYMLVSNASDYTVTLDFYNGQNTTSLNNKVIPNVPLQRNYQTNIYGSLLSSTTNFTVKIQPAFEAGSPENIPYIELPGYGLISVPKAIDATNKTITITNARELAWLGAIINGAYTRVIDANLTLNKSLGMWTVNLANDIDLGGREWIPIGNGTKGSNYTGGATTGINDPNSAFYGTGVFEGIFDGQGHTISNFKVTKPTANKYAGLFGKIGWIEYYCNGTVKNLTVKNADIQNAATGNTCATGVIAGTGFPTGIFTNNTVIDCTITGGYKVGGIVGNIYGYVNNNTVTNCTFTCTNSDGREGKNLGSIVGFVGEGSGSQVMNNTVNGGILNGYKYCGGIAGTVYNGTTVTGNVINQFTGTNLIINHLDASITGDFNPIYGRVATSGTVTNAKQDNTSANVTIN